MVERGVCFNLWLRPQMRENCAYSCSFCTRRIHHCGRPLRPLGGISDIGHAVVGVVELISGENKVIKVDNITCGVTPIHQNYLVTAAHCINDQEPIQKVRLGDLEPSAIFEGNSRPQDHEVEKFIIHPLYKKQSPVRYNDIALLKTKKQMKFNNIVFPFCISRVKPQPDSTILVGGFGQ
ncbi:hypothetical protein SK128_008143, partial [Halocaridina rubra]